jgi:hypothetical protein
VRGTERDERDWRDSGLGGLVYGAEGEKSATSGTGEKRVCLVFLVR